MSAKHLQVPLEQFLHGAIRHVACPGCVFRFVSSSQVAKSEHVSGTSESEGIAESGLQSTSGDVFLWNVCDVLQGFSRDNKNNLGMTPVTYFRYRWCAFVQFTHGNYMHVHPFSIRFQDTFEILIPCGAPDGHRVTFPNKAGFYWWKESLRWLRNRSNSPVDRTKAMIHIRISTDV